MKAVTILALITVAWGKATDIKGCEESLPTVTFPVSYNLEYSPFCTGDCYPTALIYKCPLNYILTGPAIIKCVSGKWSPNVAPVCRPVRHDPMINEGLFEGDMMGVDPDMDRNAVARDSQRWPGGIVPYEIDVSLRDTLTDGILNAMNHIMKNTCIRFVQRTAQHKHFIRIFKGNGCWSFWGFLGRGQQDVSLGDGCAPFGTIVHELLHAIGFEHEHNRSDRDEYLQINYENIEENWHYAFNKLRPDQNRLLTAFDFDSIMLYGQYSFSKQHGELKSMEAKNGRFMEEVYNKEGLSQSDIKRIRMLYQCR